MLVALLSVPLLRRALTVLALLACAVSAGGVVLIARPWRTSDASPSSAAALGAFASALCVLGAAGGAAMYKVLFRRWHGDAPPRTVALVLGGIGLYGAVLGTSLLLWLPHAFGAHGPPFEPPPPPVHNDSSNTTSGGDEDYTICTDPNWAWPLLCVRALLDIAFNGFIAYGISLIHPLFISIGTLLATPLNILATFILHSPHRVPELTEWLGMLGVLCGFLLLLADEHRSAINSNNAAASSGSNGVPSSSRTVIRKARRSDDQQAIAEVLDDFDVDVRAPVEEEEPRAIMPPPRSSPPSPPPSPSGSDPPSTLRIATLNVFYMADKDAMVEALREHLPLDVLAVQEVYDKPRLHSFAEALGMRVAICEEGDTRVCLCNALLVRNDNHEVSGVTSVKLAAPANGVTDESRVAVAIQTPHASFICTHLDHNDERTRLSQMEQLDPLLADREGAGGGSGFFLMGDFNALRRADYSDQEWEDLVRRRLYAEIATETDLIAAMENSRGLADCRTSASCAPGPTATSIHNCRIDYVWASAAVRSKWRVAECAHCWLRRVRHEGDQKDDDTPSDELTDHALVVCTLEPV